MEKWFVSMKKADFEGISKKFGIHPVTARLLRNRDIVTDEDIHNYLYGTLKDLADPKLLKDAGQGAAIIEEKIKQEKKIRIIGDYDIDGVNATYILKVGLEGLGAKVDYQIPERMKDGYGINEQLIKNACDEGIDTIITCDNGISAVDQIAYAKELGMTVVITDHHELPFKEIDGERIYIVPAADAVINPKQNDCRYPFKELCGAAVAFRFLEVLYEHMGITTKKLTTLVENVAVATVGDVMDLVGENRIYVKTGLAMMKKTSNKGLKALIEVNNLNADKLSAFHIGFVIGPCLNASGRLDTAKRALELLMAETQEEAEELAGDLLALNDSRKAMTLEGVQEAVAGVEGTELEHDQVLVIYLPDCHESLAGIIAGRIKEKYYKPTFVLTKGEEGVKGSGRSIESYHMFDEMNKCKELFTKFGGHPMAAGLSMKEEDIDTLRKTLNENAELTAEDMLQKVSIDVPMPVAYIEERIIQELELLEPFGKGNPKPLFADKKVQVINYRILGKNKNVLKLSIRDEGGQPVEAMYFGGITDMISKIEANNNRLAITYYPGFNEYMGRKNMQITIQNYI